ncbi:MAG: hypothetical protein HYR84_10605 [Planctomycetes bacterium]|nr:hypothetical protein [Planctomycetota bacterium]
MSIILAEALKELALKPGESRCVAVDDYEIEIRRVESAIDDLGPILNIWLDVPPSDKAITFVVERSETELPAPYKIDESDLAPE